MDDLGFRVLLVSFVAVVRVEETNYSLSVLCDLPGDLWVAGPNEIPWAWHLIISRDEIFHHEIVEPILIPFCIIQKDNLDILRAKASLIIMDIHGLYP